MIEVEVRGNDLESALRILKEKVVKSGLTKELKEHRCFVSKSERRREQVRKGIRRARRVQASIERRSMRWNG